MPPLRRSPLINVSAEYGGDRLAIGGESAGATLAVPTLVRMRDRHGFTGFHAAVDEIVGEAGDFRGVLDVGTLTGPGMRSYVLVSGGLREPEYLGSTATFTLGAFGGHGGRPLREGDVLTAGADPGPLNDRPARAAIDEQPSIGHRWEIAVTEGPHAAPPGHQVLEVALAGVLGQGEGRQHPDVHGRTTALGEQPRGVVDLERLAG